MRGWDDLVSEEEEGRVSDWKTPSAIVERPGGGLLEVDWRVWVRGEGRGRCTDVT